MRSLSLTRILTSLALIATPAAASDRDLADFDFVTAKIEANYSGWDSKTSGARAGELAALTKRLRRDVARGDETILRRALGQWLGWFDDGHLQVQWAAAQTDKPWRPPSAPADPAVALTRIASGVARAAPVEGIWTIDDRYRLAVLRRRPDANIFDAIVLSTKAEGWRPGEVKAVLEARSDGGFDVRYGAGDRTELRVEARLRSRDDVLDLGELGLWRRVQASPALAAAALNRWPDDTFEVRRLSPDTLLMRLPSFGDQHAETVRTLVANHAEALSTTPNLIVDIRGNGGGSDFVYDPVLPLIVSGPIRRIGVEIRVSEDNRRLRQAVAERLAASSAEAAATMRGESERMVSASTRFIQREPAVETLTLPPRPFPARVVVLVDRAGSSAENFILDARQSAKVVLMGQENSAGVIDFGEMMSMPAPSGRFELAWATTRSLRLPADPVDPDGIAPTVRIPADSDDPIDFALRWLADRK